MKIVKNTFPNLYLKPGEMSILEQPTRVTTVLGSCVTVTLYHGQLKLSAICHALLPNCKKHLYESSINDLLDRECQYCPEAFRYVDCAVSMMVEAFSRLGACPTETRVSIFGGAKMIGRKHTPVNYPVGLQNVHVARKVIADHGLNISFSDTGGAYGRKLFFNTQTGEATIQYMGGVLQGQIAGGTIPGSAFPLKNSAFYRPGRLDP